MNKLLLLLAVIIAAAVFVAGQKTSPAETQLQSAINKEVVEGDLKGAIEQYKKLAQGADKAVAARALVRLGQCYEKQGNADARKTYEQVLSKFGDQKEAVAQARTRLAALGVVGKNGQGRPERTVWEVPRDFSYFDYGGTPSPDGRYIAKISIEKRGDAKLVLHDLATGEDRVVTSDLGDGEPRVFSPDGKRMVYAWYGKDVNELRTINVDGSGTRVLLSSKDKSWWPDAWSPDGKHILVNESPVVPRPAPAAKGAPATPPAPRPPDNIALVSVSDGSMQVVKSGQGLWARGLSPDGKCIVFSHREPTAPGTPARPWAYFVMSVDGKTEVSLAPESYAASGVLWAPDGGHIIFRSKRSGSWGLWSIGMADGKPVGEPNLVVSADISPMGFARDGSLFYSASVYLADVYMAGLDPGTGKLISQPRLVNDKFVGKAVGPLTWSPDGEVLVVRKSNTRPTPMTLVLHSVHTGEDRDFPMAADSSRFPGWFFPDGRSLMIAGPGVGTWRRVDIQTGATQETWKTTTGPGPGPLGSVPARDPRYRFGFKKDAQTECDGDRCLYPVVRVDAVTDQVKEICRVRASKDALLDISISSDDSQIAVVIENPDGTQSFMTVPADGGTPREVYRGKKDFVSPESRVGGTVWTKDNRHLLVCSRQSGRPMLYSLPVDGGEPVISPLPVDLGEFDSLAVHPDGAHLAFLAAIDRTEIRVMTGLSGPAAAPR